LWDEDMVLQAGSCCPPQVGEEESGPLGEGGEDGEGFGKGSIPSLGYCPLPFRRFLPPVNR